MFCSTYGAMFKGEPNIVAANYYYPNILANPKSAIFATPSCLKIFANLRSLCKILCLYK